MLAPDGGYNTELIVLKKGDNLDRYQTWVAYYPDGRLKLGGEFAAPYIDNKALYDFDSRALPYELSEVKVHYKIEILEDLPIQVELSDVIPAFGKKGKGKQVRFLFNEEYSKLEILRDRKLINIVVLD